MFSSCLLSSRYCLIYISSSMTFTNRNRILGNGLALACNRGYAESLFKCRWHKSLFNDNSHTSLHCHQQCLTKVLADLSTFVIFVREIQFTPLPPNSKLLVVMSYHCSFTAFSGGGGGLYSRNAIKYCSLVKAFSCYLIQACQGGRGWGKGRKDLWPLHSSTGDKIMTYLLLNGRPILQPRLRVISFFS